MATERLGHPPTRADRAGGDSARPAGDEALSIVGNDAQRSSKRDDAWLIVERAIAIDVTQDLSPLR